MTRTFIITGHAYDREQVTLCVDAADATAAVAGFTKAVREAEGRRREVIIEMVLSVLAGSGAFVCDADSKEPLPGRYVIVAHFDDDAPCARTIEADSPCEAADLMMLEMEGIAEGDGLSCDVWCDAVVYIGQATDTYHTQW